MKNRYVFAIDNQHVALLKKERNQFSVEHIRTLESHVKPLDTLKPILYKKNPLIVSGLCAKKLILRRLELPLQSRKEIMAALPFQAEQHLPFKLDEMISLPSIQLGKKKSLIDLIATQKKSLKEHLEFTNSLGISPEVVSSVPTALFRFAEFLYPKQGSLLIYDPKKQLLAAMKDHCLVAFQFVTNSELSRTLEFFKKKFPSIEQILTIGPPPQNLPLQCLKIENEEWIPYATAIGLALDAAKSDKRSHQFLSSSYSSISQRKKLRKTLTRFFTFSIFFCFCLTLLSHMYFKKDSEVFLRHLNLSNNLSLKQTAEHLRNSSNQAPRFPFAPFSLPKVHDILIWLSNHPDLQKDISIDHLKYQITKRPKIGSRTPPYEGKIDLQFSTKFPRVARKLHESLEKDTQFVDDRKPVTFKAGQGSYKVSFYMSRNSS